MRRRIGVSHDARSALEEIRPPEITDEDEVASGDAHRFARTAADISDLVAQVLRRVPGRVNGAKVDVANLEGRAVLEQRGVVVSTSGLLMQPLVLPVGIALVGDIDACAFFGELAQAAQKVRVDMGVGRRDDA